MSQFILTPAMEPSFLNARDPVQVCRADGMPVGFFLPLESYKKLLANLPIPYSMEELIRRRNEQGGMSLEEFWKTREPA